MVIKFTTLSHPACLILNVFAIVFFTYFLQLDIFRYFLINDLKMDPQMAEVEADKTNKYVAQKVAQIKDIKTRKYKKYSIKKKQL